MEPGYYTVYLIKGRAKEVQVTGSDTSFLYTEDGAIPLLNVKYINKSSAKSHDMDRYGAHVSVSVREPTEQERWARAQKLYNTWFEEDELQRYES